MPQIFVQLHIRTSFGWWAFLALWVHLRSASTTSTAAFLRDLVLALEQVGLQLSCMHPLCVEVLKAYSATAAWDHVQMCVWGGHEDQSLGHESHEVSRCTSM